MIKTWGNISSQTQRGYSTLFWLRTMVSDLGVLILMPAASQLDEANRVMSSAKSGEAILTSTNRTPSTPWQRLEILSIKVMNRNGNKGQPWRSPTLSGNECDLLQTMRTKLSLHLYRDWIAHSNGPSAPEDILTDMVKCLLQVHRAHMQWLGKRLCSLQDPIEGTELVQWSMARTGSALFLLNLRFNYQLDFLFQHPCIYLTREAEKCDSLEIGAHPPVLFLEKGNRHHPSLPIHRYCLQCPCDVAETCQARQFLPRCSFLTTSDSFEDCHHSRHQWPCGWNFGQLLHRYIETIEPIQSQCLPPPPEGDWRSIRDGSWRSFWQVPLSDVPSKPSLHICLASSPAIWSNSSPVNSLCPFPNPKAHRSYPLILWEKPQSTGSSKLEISNPTPPWCLSPWETPDWNKV